ncbi:MAG: response regulator [Geobacteraceae bacterium]|nr:response regulator [Geobacteraceae bacterium]
MNARELVPATPARVMVVDDEECIRHTLFELLSAEGIGTVTADGAVECLRLMRAGFRGVILMDVMMPGKNGWDTIREIQTCGLLEGNIISMLTAMDFPDERMEGLQEIVVDYITKPFDPAVLISAVRKYLGYLDQVRGGN